MPPCWPGNRGRHHCGWYELRYLQQYAHGPEQLREVRSRLQERNVQQWSLFARAGTVHQRCEWNHQLHSVLFLDRADVRRTRMHSEDRFRLCFGKHVHVW